MDSSQTAARRLTRLQAIEFSHLALLEVLPTRLDQRTYVLKGGANLRYYFGSPRYSADIDFDVANISKPKLEEKVDKVLASRSLTFILRTNGLGIKSTNKATQTETTQRWKLALAFIHEPSEGPIGTKLEFSRRGADSRHQLEQVPIAIVEPYALRPPTVSRYSAAAMIELKIRALGERTETQARDLFDLDLLFRKNPELARPGSIDATKVHIRAAIERAADLPFQAYTSQVVAFLDPDAMELYASEAAWDNMQQNVIGVLSRLE